jgi:flagellar biogenesis protein FliO
MERQSAATGRQREGASGRQVGRLVVGACLLSLVVTGGAAVSRAAEPASVPANTGQSMPQPPNQERFLQNFISQSLGQGAPPTATPSALPAPGPQPAVVSPQPSQLQPSQPTGDLTAAAMKMVLSLGGILGLLVLGGYVIRRYLLNQTFLGKRTPMMRVLARVNITPKAGVALLEVPGKVLVIGITGSTLVALGELTTGTTPALELPTVEPPVSFATTLDNSTGSRAEDEKTADVLLKVSEVIQQKMSRLKQL